MDLVVIAIRQPDLLRAMILQIEREIPGVVVLIVGEDNDRVEVDDVLQETGCRWIAMQSGGEISPSKEVERRVREIKTEKLNIVYELSKPTQDIGSRVLIRNKTSRLSN